ncbi:MAG: hypothetical protein WDN03_15160 [Rhizomicrobium sp.]
MTDILSRADFVSQVAFNADGLVPVIAQRAQTGEVLMFAWMTRETLERTLQTGEGHLLVAGRAPRCGARARSPATPSG